MPEDVCSNKRVLQEIVHLHQKCITGISIDYHLINLAQSKIILHLLTVISFSVCPMAKTAWQAVRCKLVHDSCWNQLKVGWKWIQAKFPRLIPGSVNAIA